MCSLFVPTVSCREPQYEQTLDFTASQTTIKEAEYRPVGHRKLVGLNHIETVAVTLLFIFRKV